MVEYNANSNRYLKMHYKACGNSGLKFPRIALGLWYNFGVSDDYENCKRVVEQAFDLGITYFDLANNYGPPPGTAEMCFGRILKNLASYRDEIIVSSKAGFFMWDGPYGEGTSKKHLIASLDQSLKRLDIDYVDIFYLHRFDEATPLEEI